MRAGQECRRMDATEAINGRSRTLTGTTKIDSRASWTVALTALGIYSVSFGAPLITVVALKQIAADLGSTRSVPSLAFSLAWFGAAVGGVGMGWLAERIGVRWVVVGGAFSIAAGLALSSLGGETALLVGHGVFIGLLGNAGINAPLYVYVSRWFDRRRGSAVALISSGMYLAGVIWPTLFERGIAVLGWQQTMLLYAAFQFAAILPAALLVFGAPPEASGAEAAAEPAPGARVLGWSPRVVQVLLCAAGFLCCIP